MFWWPDSAAGSVVASAFDEPTTLYTGFRFGASEGEVDDDVGGLVGSSLLLVCGTLGLALPLGSLIDCLMPARCCSVLLCQSVILLGDLALLCLVVKAIQPW